MATITVLISWQIFEFHQELNEFLVYFEKYAYSLMFFYTLYTLHAAPIKIGNK